MTGPTVAPRDPAALDNIYHGGNAPDPATWSGLATEARAIGVPLGDEAIARLQHYRDLLFEWNGRMNLTAIREPDEAERVLFLDGLAMIPSLDRIMGSGRGSSAGAALIDIGSGAGFPGLVLKIARPGLDVTLVDATAKKVSFLNAVIAELGLRDVRTVHGRAETLGQDGHYRGQFALATARAVAPLPVLVEYVVPLLRLGGTALLPKGLTIEAELRQGRLAAGKIGARIVSADRTAMAASRLVIVDKVAPTPGKYPRRIGVPSQFPLPGEN